MKKGVNMLRFVIRGLTVLACCGSAWAASDAADARLLDELIGQQVSPQGAPGAAAVLVRRDGRVTLRAYGLADLGAQRAVDAQSTVFRIGSLSKTFTALAVLQLVDEGKIELEADANRYLKGVQIPLRGTPVRVLDLLTHRAGLDGDLTFVGLNDPVAAAQSSDSRLQRDIVPVRAPGTLPSYDNMAWGLLGHIVESVDGLPYAQAIRKRIFSPLGMTHSQVGLPTDLAQVATAYEVGSDGKPHAQPQIYLRRGWQGAGDLSTTAGDMALFLQAMLAQTAYPGGRLLKEQTFARQVDTTHFGFHPGLRSTGLGVYALGQVQGGGFGHGGTVRGFNASMVVLPRQDLAFFAVMNLNSPAPEMSLPGLIDYLSHPPGPSALDPTDYMTIDLPYLLEQRLQAPVPAAAAAAGERDRQDWSGRYAGLRMQSYEALLPRLAVALLLPTKNVRVQDDGTLFVGATGPYRRTAEGLYALDQPAGPLTKAIGFAQVGDTLVMGPHTLQASRRLAWYERAGLTAGGLLLAPLLLLLVAALHARKAEPRQRRLDVMLAAGALFLLAVVAAEISLATRWQRLENLGWIVSLWRAGVALALLALAAAAMTGLLRAFGAPPTQPGGAQRAPGRGYRVSVALLVSWVVFAALYWQLPGHG